MNPVTMNSFISKFQYSWERYQNKKAKKFMHSDKIIDFLWDLGLPLGEFEISFDNPILIPFFFCFPQGFHQTATQLEIGKAVLAMNIRWYVY